MRDANFGHNDCWFSLCFAVNTLLCCWPCFLCPQAPMHAGRSQMRVSDLVHSCAFQCVRCVCVYPSVSFDSWTRLSVILAEIDRTLLAAKKEKNNHLFQILNHKFKTKKSTNAAAALSSAPWKHDVSYGGVAYENLRFRSPFRTLACACVLHLPCTIPGHTPHTTPPHTIPRAHHVVG